MRYYLGMAATFHDPALALVNDGGAVVFAEAAERYRQDKRAFHAAPDHLLQVSRLLDEHLADDPDVELVLARNWSTGFARRLRRLAAGLRCAELFWRLVSGRGAEAGGKPGALIMLRWMVESMRHSLAHAGWNLRYQVEREVVRAERESPSGAPRRRVRIRECAFDHHLTHAAAAAYASPFTAAACAVIDGFGEQSTTACFRYEGGRIAELPSSRSRHSSLGFYYMQLCLLCRFDPLQGEEWKVMGLAAYGQRQPELYANLRGLFQVDGLQIRSRNLTRAWDDMLRWTRGLPAADVAHTGQLVYEDVLFEYLRRLHQRTRLPRLVLGGGCGLNSSANGKILEQTPFQELYVGSAPADDGTALGAAWLAFLQDHPQASLVRSEPLSPYLGSAFSARGVEQLRGFGGAYVRPTREDPALAAARLLADGQIIGWAHGRAEFGPRALGHRSILADPRRPSIRDELNSRVKFREEFRPFAPSILHEHGPAYFENYQDSPYMERAVRFRPEMRARVPGVVHVDGTGRLQSVTRERDERFHRLIEEFYRLTGVPLVLNTSFNVMGKPIIHSVEDAVSVFLTSGLDALVLDDVILEKRSAEQVES